MGRFRRCGSFTELIERSLKSVCQLLRRSLAPVMQEYDRRTRADHVVMDGNHGKTMTAKRFEDRLDFVSQHGYITGDGRLLIVADEGGPGVKTHPGVDQSAHFFELQIVAANGYLINGSILLTFLTHDFRDLSCIDF